MKTSSSLGLRTCLSIAGALAAFSFCAGCGPTAVAISSNPPEAQVSVDGASLGQAPVSYAFDFSKRPTFIVLAQKEGYFDETRTLTVKSREAQTGFSIEMKTDPSYAKTVKSEAGNTWLRVQVAPKLSWETMWRTLVDSVNDRYKALETMDATSGYIRSTYLMEKFAGLKGDFRIRTRFIGSVAQKDPVVYKIMIESEICRNNVDWDKHDRIFKEDDTLIQEVRDRLSAK